MNPRSDDQTTKAVVLRARAKELAREPAAPADAENILEVVEFSLAHERYAIESVYVREVHPLEDLTPLPCTPPFVAGLVNVRGRILPVIDLKKFFDLPESGITDLHQILLVHASGMEFGLLADTIVGVRGIPLGMIQPSLAALTGIRVEYLKGVTVERLVILAADRIVGDPRIIVHEEIDL